MTSNLFPDPTNEAPGVGDTKPPLKAAPDRKHQLLEALTLTLGFDPDTTNVTALHQDGRDPDDAQYIAQLSDSTALNLGPISNIMSRPKVQQTMLVRHGVTPPTMKAAEWQEAIAGIIAGAAELVETVESLAARAQEWATQYLEIEPPTTERNTACLERVPYKDEDGHVHLVLSKLAKYVARTTTDQLTERKLGAALRDAGWEQQTLMYYPEGETPDGKPRGKRTSVSYYRAPIDTA